MALAHREVPPVTWVEECDFEAVDLKLLVPAVLKACALSLQEYPELNARLEGDEIVYLDRYDIGVAVQTEQGLVVPVVRGCESTNGRGARRRGRAPRRRGPGRHAPAGRAARVDLHGDQRGQARRPLPHADRQSPRGGDPRHRSDRSASRRSRRRGRRPPDGHGRRHVRPPRGRRCAGGRVRARRDRRLEEPTTGQTEAWHRCQARWAPGTGSASPPASASVPGSRSAR